MKNYLEAAKASIAEFGHEDEGAQVVEYALIIALVSIALAVALSALDLNVTALSTRIADCLTGNTAC